jgi:tetratricopeptide (TPR) repeat protein
MDKYYGLLKTVAIVMGVSIFAYMLLETFILQKSPADRAFEAGQRAFEDRRYEQALADYERSLALQPDVPYVLTGRALALMHLDRDEDALAAFERALEIEPEQGIIYANRGILLDRLGEHERALADYEHALRLDPELAEGPRWLTRFLRNQPEKPPTIADRAEYLRMELAKPPEERFLRDPEIDEQQRHYKK